jgi:hypothetical protein
MNGTCKISGTPMKRSNLGIVGMGEGEEKETKGIDNLFNRKSHPGTESLQNIKPPGPKEKHPQTHHN